MAALVQHKAASALASSVTVVLDNDPIDGNLLVAFLMVNNDVVSFPQAGWTPVPDDAGIPIPLDGTLLAYYRIASGDDASFTFTTTSVHKTLSISEYSGVTGLSDSATHGSSGVSATLSVGPASLAAATGVAVGAIMVSGSGAMGGNTLPDLAAISPYTELHYSDVDGITDPDTSIGTKPTMLVAYDLLGASGDTTLEVSLETGVFANGPYCGVLLVFDADAPPPDPDPEPEPPEYVPPSPGRAILEIYVSDPSGDRWDVALWDTATWGDAGWVSITPWSIIADVSWGADRAESGILSDQVPGTWVVETHDPDRVLDPGNPDSQFYPEIVPGLPIRLLHHSRIIRQGQVTRAWYSHSDRGGRINATDVISLLANAKVPEDTILSDTVRLRSIEAIEAAGLDIIAWPPIIGGDPAVAPAPSGDFSAWDVISEAAREVLLVPWVNNGNRLTFRAWDAPLKRGRVISAPVLIDLVDWISDEGLLSVVRAQEPGGALEERRATPTPRYGERVHERTRDTINAETWAERVLANRRDASLRYVPGDIYPLIDADVAWLARLEIMEDVILSVPGADPPVLVTARVLGMNVRAVDETVQTDPLLIRTKWRWRIITTVVATEPLYDDETETEFLYADQDPTQPLYPDGA